MKLIEINTNPSRRELKQFAFAWLVFFLLIAGLMHWKGACAPIVWAVVSVAILVPSLGCLSRQALRPAYLGMAYLAYPIGFVLSHLILMLVYYLIMTPTGLILRLTNRGFFPKKPDPEIGSYWTAKTRTRKADDYFKQY